MDEDEEQDNYEGMMMKKEDYNHLNLQSLKKTVPPKGPNPPIPGRSSTSTIAQKGFAGRRAMPPPQPPCASVWCDN